MLDNDKNKAVKDCEAILDAMQVPGHKSVYCVGSFEKGKITIHSQQTRALNLAYAIITKELCHVDEAGRLQLKKTAKSIAIVGAGFSGMTIAYALSNIPHISLHVFEQYEGTFDMQRKSDRVIHPNVFDWPATGCDQEETLLPFFNWRMAKVTDVINNLSKQTELRKENYKSCFKQYSRVSITMIESKDAVVTVTHGKKDVPEIFDMVIVCVGFGKEEIQKQSYWLKDNDDVNSDGIDSRHLFLGNGDGGIIDSIRIALYDFRYDDFISDLVTHDYFKMLGNSLVDEEKTIGALPLSEEEKAVNLYTFYKKAVKQDKTSQHIKELLKKHKKSETRNVHLVGRAAAPFSFYANPLNKLLISIFCDPDFGYIQYHNNLEAFKNLLVPPIDKKNKVARFFLNLAREVRLAFEMSKYKKVKRTGPRPVIFSLFKEHKEEDIREKTKQLKELDIGNKQYWLSVPGFFTGDGFNIDDQQLGLNKKTESKWLDIDKGPRIL